MLAHISIGVTDLARARGFYDAVLAPLGYARVYDVPGAHGYGTPNQPSFWIGGEAGTKPNAGFHVAFMAKDRKAVQAFHAAALKAGGQDNGKPGLRPEYTENYYAAFVLDPDGHHIEAVTFSPA
jgi:catechol 2,3-dioxygenase-like lactoylglutathione lyase family enzyme